MERLKLNVNCLTSCVHVHELFLYFDVRVQIDRLPVVVASGIIYVQNSTVTIKRGIKFPFKRNGLLCFEDANTFRQK